MNFFNSPLRGSAEMKVIMIDTHVIKIGFSEALHHGNDPD